MVRKKVAESEMGVTISRVSSKPTPPRVPQTETSGEPVPVNFDVEDEFRKIYNKAIKLGITQDEFASMDVIKEITWKGSCVRTFLRYIAITILLIVVLLYSVLFMYVFNWPIRSEGMVHFWLGMWGEDIEQECLVGMPEFANDIFRPPVECSFCENLTTIETVYNISQEDFEDIYAYSGIPVVIGDGTVNWTAPKYFSFEFFKDIYKLGSSALVNQMHNCQFFPYKTEFNNLGEVLGMSLDRATMADGSKPWYIGWSNCDFNAANILRKHYKRPYFLPELSESSRIDWMFMGSPGYGAHLHIDNVGNPSWQAQITGTKQWTLEPPPECYFTCVDKLHVTIHPGQIIVIDTNIWYHSTLNVGDDISITIGSEFD